MKSFHAEYWEDSAIKPKAHLYVTERDRAPSKGRNRCCIFGLAPAVHQGTLHFPCAGFTGYPFARPPPKIETVFSVGGRPKQEVIKIAIYHCSIKVISRGKGQSAVSAAAYRSGTNLVNEWSGIPANYSKRTCVVYSEIMLPENAPESFSDRQTLWNSVEMNEKRADAQLAREIEVSLPKELPPEENIRLVREYAQQFVDAGMCADFNIHDKQDGNPHCHILLTMRVLDENGKWLPKSHQAFDLDENGERIRLPNGRWKSHKVFTTDWDDHDQAEHWRIAWEELVNRFLEANEVSERIDHRSNAARDISELPAVHMGPAACAMEKKGIQTERGEINRMIRNVNRTIKEIGQKISGLKNWLNFVENAGKRLTSKETSPLLVDLFQQYWNQENQRMQKYSTVFRLNQSASSFKNMMDTLDALNAEGIFTLNDLETELSVLQERTNSIHADILGRDKRLKELQKLIENGNTYQQYEPVRKERNSIHWKKQKDSFDESHHAELALWNAANRFLHAHDIDADALPELMKTWQAEYQKLDQDYSKEYTELKDCRTRVKQLDKIHRQIEKALAPEQAQKQNIEQEKT